MCKTLQCSVIFEENIQKLSPFKKKKKNAHLIKNAVVTTYVPSNSCPPPLKMLFRIYFLTANSPKNLQKKGCHLKNDFCDIFKN